MVETGRPPKVKSRAEELFQRAQEPLLVLEQGRVEGIAFSVVLAESAAWVRVDMEMAANEGGTVV
ncbi:hypothetical protein [Streptacidiphilus albus]|uniref:hypothetical protein n=1 Tax=Streptacidiphilus albus TaxID=105425 RepID=UPI0012E08FC7|nr:hypothetical protein [Streptacidiphilus albus]